MKDKLIIFLLFACWASPAWADWLGCFEPSASVDGYTVQFSGTATSVSANVIDPDDTTVATATPAMAAVGSAATDLWSGASFSVGASPVYGVWTIQYVGTVSGSVVRGSDLFEVRATCPVKPSVAGRTLDVAATGEGGVDFSNVNGTLDAAEIGADAITAAKIAAGALNGKGDWNTVTPPTAAQNATAIWDELTATARTAGSYGAMMKAGGAGDLAAILGDTNELQVDWVNGGRLDLLLDGIKLKTDYLPSATAGAAGGVFIAGTNAQTTVTSGFGANSITATTLADGALTSAKASPTFGYTYCDISASTSGSSFTLASCTDWQGAAVTIVAEKFNGLLLMAYTNGGATCNVNGEGVLVESMTAGGVVTAKTDAPLNSGFKAAPSATNCGVLIAK